jgi:hypothetical protein
VHTASSETEEAALLQYVHKSFFLLMHGGGEKGHRPSRAAMEFGSHSRGLRMHTRRLPVEVVVSIANWLPLRDIGRMGLACRALHSLLAHDVRPRHSRSLAFP